MIPKEIFRIIKRMRENYKPEKIILFGSYAYGNPTEDSDLDLLIIKDTKKSRVERFVEVKRLVYDPKLKTPVSPIVYTKKEIDERKRMGDAFIEEILKKGVVLYDHHS